LSTVNYSQLIHKFTKKPELSGFFNGN